MKRAAPKAKPVQVVSFTRRSDGPANPEQLESFITGLEAGAVTYAHPKFALNKGNDKTCTFPVVADGETVISWWSKDFGLLRNRWNDEKRVSDLLAKFKHHFSFTINGPEYSALEPGLESTLAERVETQLSWLVNLCRRLGQDPNASIMVHVDPIYVYTTSGEKRDNLGHIPHLCHFMQLYGLKRMHISFVQREFQKTKSRLLKLEPTLIVHDLSDDEKRDLLSAKLLPFTLSAGIEVQTCTAIGLGVSLGACVGWSDINSITGGATTKLIQKSQNRSTAHCQCYPHRDVGDKSKGCKHGCRYCFSNPKIYDW